MEKKFFKTYDEVNSLRKINDFFADYSLAPHRNMPHFETLNPKQKKFKKFICTAVKNDEIGKNLEWCEW